jgi:hypothetical protein
MIEKLGQTKTKWDYRFFHIKADGKVKEMDVLEVRGNKRYQSNWLIVFVGKTNIGFMKDGASINLTVNTLKEILTVNQKETVTKK